MLRPPEQTPFKGVSMIDTINYFTTENNLIGKIARKIWSKNAKPAPDWFETPHNKSFILDADFKRGYNLACANIGEDYRIPWRVHQAIWCAHHCLSIEGDFVELGTGKGFIMQSVLGSINNWSAHGKKLWLYDTFKKFGETGKGKAIHDHYYAPNLEQVKNYFAMWEDVLFIEGDVYETILNSKPDRISFLHVDLNNGELEVKVLENIFPLLSSGSIVLLDDYANRGEEEAYSRHNSFFLSKSLKILTTPAGQGIVVIK